MPVVHADSHHALIIGESLIDLVKTQGEPGEPVAHPGGSPFNVALTLGRLERLVHLATWFAGDTYGQQIVDHLRESNVKVLPGSDLAERTGTALANIDSTGSATYTFNIDWQLPADFSIPADAAYVHTSSLGSIIMPGSLDVLAAMRDAATKTLTTYDPNIRPTIMGNLETVRPFVEEYIKIVDLVKVSDEDLAWLYPGVSLDEIAANWFALGSVQIIIVTCGGAGPTLWTRSGLKITKAPAKVTVADTVGAGDSFMGALLNSLWNRGITFREGAHRLGNLSRTELEQILEEANRVSGITVSRPGANPPWLAELS